jgi:DNA-binding GntR family transcriptional regulator
MAFSLAAATVDRSSPVPLYYQLAQQMERAIESGELPRGTQLGNEILLADQLGLSRPTVRRAIGYLVDRGVLVRKRGVGTQVVQPRVRRAMELTSLYDDLAGAGQEPTTRVLALDRIPAPDLVARALGLTYGEPVLALERLRLVRGEPLAVMHNYLPVDLVALTREALERTGLYQLMRAAGVRLHVATQTVGARSATAAEARLLSDRRGAPVLTMQRTVYDDSGRAVEFGRHYYRASLYTFEFVLSNHPHV